MRAFDGLTDPPAAPEPREAPFAHAGKHLSKTLCAGLVILAPVLFTLVVLKVVLGFFDSLLGPAVAWLTGTEVPGLGIVALVVLTYLAGLIDANVFGRRLLARMRRVLLAIPAIRSVYAIGARLTDAFSSGRPTGFKRVVRVEYPRQGAWAVGFLSGFTAVSGERYAIVYIPTSPLPNSGWMGLFRPSEVYDVDMTMPQALEAVLSGGIVFPAGMTSTSVSTDAHLPADGAPAIDDSAGGRPATEGQPVPAWALTPVQPAYER